ncbi:MAG TPA: hypothetical protein VGQ13_04020 [Nitrososphaera sp.]|jgi:hypothetical protein|nr:hypothetical protein [Nitrososphaera sp.]
MTAKTGSAENMLPGGKGIKPSFATGMPQEAPPSKLVENLQLLREVLGFTSMYDAIALFGEKGESKTNASFFGEPLAISLLTRGGLPKFLKIGADAYAEYIVGRFEQMRIAENMAASIPKFDFCIFVRGKK